MKMVARGPQDGARLVELFGGVWKKKVFLYFPQVLHLCTYPCQAGGGGRRGKGGDFD